MDDVITSTSAGDDAGDDGWSSANDGKIRWGIIGSGNISHDFCVALKTLPPTEHQMVAVAARRQEDANDFAKRHGINKAYSDYQSIGADPNIDVVYIGVIHPYHAAFSVMMLKAGKHVLCEKPMCMSSDECEMVLQAARENKKLFVEGVWSRFFPAYDQLRSELSRRSVGDVKALSVQFGFKQDAASRPRLSSLELGGGVTLNLGCYPIYLANLVFDMKKPEKIFVHGYHYATGADRALTATLLYSGDRMAQFFVAADCQLSNTAIIYGADGMIQMPMFWCPTELKTPQETFRYDLPVINEKTNFANAAGFVYEIKAVREAILQSRHTLNV